MSVKIDQKITPEEESLTRFSRLEGGELMNCRIEEVPISEAISFRMRPI